MKTKKMVKKVTVTKKPMPKKMGKMTKKAK